MGANRSTVDDLQDKGVLKAGPGMSAALVESREQLQKEMTKDAVEKGLANRSTVDQLQDKGVLTADAVEESHPAAPTYPVQVPLPEQELEREVSMMDRLVN